MRCLYLRPDDTTGLVVEPRLDATTERHKLELSVQAQSFGGDALGALDADPGLQGLVIELELGWPGRRRLKLARQALARGRRVWLYWPLETAVEVIDPERARSYWRHWAFVTGAKALWRLAGGLASVLYRVAARLPQPPGRVVPVVYRTVEAPTGVARPHDLDGMIAAANPVPFDPGPATPGRPIPGCGVYLRTDFWARIESGGSYGHTCYVAKELAAVTERFVCFMAHRYRLLDELGVPQVVMAPPPGPDSEDTIVNATNHYLLALRAAFEVLRPAYIYERVCLGNYVGALLSREMNIPYIVEYNGSEISMRRSFDGAGYVHEKEYLQAEAFAFKQATMISVVSAEVKAGLVARGVREDKILVNPNGADLVAYAPGTAEERTSIRTELGFGVDQPVVGFTGTFGGWHGIDVLAAALPQIASRVPAARFLMIGDGNYKHLLDGAVAEHGLGDRVRSVGRVPQAEGARLLKACDIYVSPHSSHMVDSKFFGSPTKIFEYMAMGGAIVASDLEQIGQILSPALRASDLADGADAGDARAVLCEPGNVAEFVEAVSGLLEQRTLWPVLGGNARRAVEAHYSWARHVARLWPFLGHEPGAGSLEDLRRKDDGAVPEAPAPAAPAAGPAGAGRRIETGDRYKDEVQKQWDNDAAGSHYVKAAPPNTLEWFLEVEQYRYGTYAPWMLDVMEFTEHAGEDLLEIGGGIGTDLSRFARGGARITDLDLSSGHLALAQENFRQRGLPGRFIHHDAETLPFDDNSFDVVYSNGVIHHTPNTRSVVEEIRRVLRPGGKAIIMVYAENSLHYWRNLVWAIGIKEGALQVHSMAEIMARAVERNENASARPLVKVYTPQRLRALFDGFEVLSIEQRQMVSDEKPRLLTRVPLTTLERLVGWNLIIKARKPAR